MGKITSQTCNRPFAELLAIAADGLVAGGPGVEVSLAVGFPSIRLMVTCKEYTYEIVAEPVEWSAAIAKAGIHSAIKLAERPVDMARELRHGILRGVADATSQGITIRDRDVDEPLPGPGWVVYEQWALRDHDRDVWYPDEQGAQAHLERLAIASHKTVTGRSVNLTSDGCSESRAYYRHELP